MIILKKQLGTLASYLATISISYNLEDRMIIMTHIIMNISVWIQVNAMCLLFLTQDVMALLVMGSMKYVMMMT